MPRLTVSMGSLRLGRAGDVLETFGIGSCMAIVLHDPQARLAAMAHAMLSGDQALPLQVSSHPLRFVERVIPLLLDELERAGASRRHIVAHIAGGAQMFASYADPSNAIGPRNVRATHASLEELGIPIASEHTGGRGGRNLHFTVESGVAECSA